MAGHSKWANIRHTKARIDAKRGKVFTKLIRELTVAARGGDDPASNPALRLAIDNARGQNMPKDTMQRAIERGAGGGEGDSLEQIFYEGYGPHNVAVLVECLTDNKNRTAGEVRHVFTKNERALSKIGDHMFRTQGKILIKSKLSEDELLELALDGGAEESLIEDDARVLLTGSSDLHAVVDAVRAKEIEIENAELTRIPSSEVEIESSEALADVLKFTDALEELDDVQNVFSTLKFDPELLKELNES